MPSSRSTVNQLLFEHIVPLEPLLPLAAGHDHVTESSPSDRSCCLMTRIPKSRERNPVEGRKGARAPVLATLSPRRKTISLSLSLPLVWHHLLRRPPLDAQSIRDARRHFSLIAWRVSPAQTSDLLLTSRSHLSRLLQ